MSQLAHRLLTSRKNKNLSQQQLAELAKVHFTNIGKYERGEAIPSADVLNRIAKALDVTNDFLLNGSIKDIAHSSIKDSALLTLFQKTEKLPENKKMLIKEFLDSFLLKNELQQKLSF